MHKFQMKWTNQTGVNLAFTPVTFRHVPMTVDRHNICSSNTWKLTDPLHHIAHPHSHAQRPIQQTSHLIGDGRNSNSVGLVGGVHPNAGVGKAWSRNLRPLGKQEPTVSLLGSVLRVAHTVRIDRGQATPCGHDGTVHPLFFQSFLKNKSIYFFNFPTFNFFNLSLNIKIKKWGKPAVITKIERI